MPDFVYEIPQHTLAVYFSLATIAAMAFGLLVIKPLLRLLLGAGPDLNASISYSTSGFSLFYGLLLGLLTVSAYQNSERVKEAILSEAAALATLYADMNAYPEPTRSDMKDQIRDYVLFTIHRDWREHRRGEFLNGGNNRADAMRQRLANFQPESVGQEVVHREVVSEFQDFMSARKQRLTGVFTQIPDVLWYAVLVGAAINILLLSMLRIRLLQHFVLGTITSFFLGVILFVIVILDDPLRGESGLKPWPFELVWEREMAWDEPLSSVGE